MYKKVYMNKIPLTFFYVKNKCYTFLSKRKISLIYHKGSLSIKVVISWKKKNVSEDLINNLKLYIHVILCST